MNSFKRYVRQLISISGILVVIGALLSDVVLSGLNSGIGPLQIGVALIGLFVAILPWVPFAPLGRLALVLATFVISAVLMELALGALGFQPDYRAPPVDVETAEIDLVINPARVCDDIVGCHWNVEVVTRNCEDPEFPRMCEVNNYGFSSPHEFTTEALPEDAYRILVLGDSFTWGASADFKQGWVDILEREVTADQVIVWNAAMPGTGTKQAILTAKELLPIMKPDLVVLGFHTGNDFADNLYPVDRFVLAIADGAGTVTTQQYTLDENGEPFLETPNIIYFRAKGYNVSTGKGFRTRLEYAVTSTRIGTLILGAAHVFNWRNANVPITEALVGELWDLVESNGSQFMVAIIPEQNDTTAPTNKYQSGIEVMDTLKIPYLDMLPLLEFADFENENPGNKHLNNEGHRKGGLSMVACVNEIITSNELVCSNQNFHAP